MDSTQVPTILVIDDDPFFHDIVRMMLADQGYAVWCISDPSELKDSGGGTVPSAILLDWQLQHSDGTAFIQPLRRQYPLSPVAFVTGYSSPEVAAAAIKLGAFDFLTKPLDKSRLLIAVAKAVEQHRLLARLHSYEDVAENGFEGMIGTSPQMQTVYSVIRNVAQTDVAVMVSGESGTGKELVAGAIHRRSRRSGGPFVAINMASIPEELAEATLFGHEKGAFTGADKQRAGAVREAGKGTLFLDEITEMPMPLQSKLLRFLQESTFRPVGADHELRADTRIVSATNRNPSVAVREQRLREDLYYRLNVVPIQLPPLRERDGDVPLLVRHAVRVLSKKHGKQFREIHEGALEALVRYDWPGNVRQLMHVMERAVVINHGEVIEPHMLPAEMMPSGPWRPAVADRSDVPAGPTVPLPEPASALPGRMGNPPHASALPRPASEPAAVTPPTPAPVPPAAATAKSLAVGERVLIVDDDPITLRILDHYLRAAGYNTINVEEASEAIRSLSDEVGVVVLDLDMPTVSGVEFLRQARRRCPGVSVVMVSDREEAADAQEALEQGAFALVAKPIHRDELVACISQARGAAKLARQRQDPRESREPAGTVFDFVARAAATQQLLRRATKTAPLDTPVLLTGEGGAGKSTRAGVIHQSGPRAAGPFVSVNCALSPAEALEAELFGAGGAESGPPGCVELADGGTLFLDRIGELPRELQAALLTFLKQRTIPRGRKRVVDARVIAATQRDLAAMCREGTFSDDLYQALNVISLPVPPLRERVDDIPEVAQQILARIARRRRQKPLACDPAAIVALKRHCWPGNVKELENVLERASTFCEGERIGVEDLTFSHTVELPVTVSALPAPLPAPVPAAPPSLAGRTLDQLEEQAIRDTLQATGGNKAESARRLGISEKSIYNKMKRFNIRA